MDCSNISLAQRKREIASALQLMLPPSLGHSSEEQQSMSDKRKQELLHNWQDMAWQEARKARYVRCRATRQLDLEVEVFPTRINQQQQ